MCNRILGVSLTIILFMLFSCSSRQKREEKYSNGSPKQAFQIVEKSDGSFLKDGYYKEWFENGQIAFTGNYENNQKSGDWKSYFMSGQLKSEVQYQNGLEEGFEKEYAENGQILISRTYKKGQLEGAEKIWYSNGQIKAEANHTAGKLNGSFKMLNDDGSPKINCQFEYGKCLTVLGKWLLSYKSNDIGYTQHITFKDDNTTIDGNLMDDKGVPISEAYKETSNTYLFSYDGGTFAFILNDKARYHVAHFDNKTLEAVYDENPDFIRHYSRDNTSEVK